MEPQRAKDTAGEAHRRGRRWQWAVPPVLLAVLLARIPLVELGAGLGRGPVGWLALYTLAQVATTLALDGVATRVALAGAGIRRPLGTLIRVRGATYLLAVLHYVLGQGGLYVYLRRTGVGAGRAAAAVLVLTTGALGNMVVVVAVLWPMAATAPQVPGLRHVVAALAILAAAGLLLAIVRPAVGSRIRWLAPVVELEPRAHLAAWIGRLPHTAGLLAGHWGALRLWGIPVPFGEGMALVAVVLLVTALPLAPAGLGTFEAAQVLLMSGFVPAAAADVRAAAVLAFALVYHALGLGAQVGLGFLCLRLGGSPTAEAAAP